RLLRYYGAPTKLTGSFDVDTIKYVKSFQQMFRLSPDGVVGQATWRKLTPVLRRGSQNVAVRALQEALNAKRGYGLSVDGIFGVGTEQAVKAFQRHMGLVVDGIVGPATWTALNSHFVNLGDQGPGWYRYVVSDSDSSWGTAHTVATLHEVGRRWQSQGYKLRIGINDISLPHGGYFPPHASHRNGRDADLRPMRNDGAEAPVTWKMAAYSRQLTQALVDQLWATGEVELIFFNDPSVRGVQHWPGHDDHLHVRFKR
ncbi:MAG TPA: penicillin-insensitive murein endopeptidase, partial [Symbiobacteriaceae bacterium]|nr:penicillin-insensitive murein endopeptidase [Symbiobacteriaceae bacterium]